MHLQQNGQQQQKKMVFGSVSICHLNNYYKLRAIFPYFHVHFGILLLSKLPLYGTVKSATDHFRNTAVVYLVYTVCIVRWVGLVGWSRMRCRSNASHLYPLELAQENEKK